MIIDDEALEEAIGLLRAAKRQRSGMYLKGCINYIVKMKPKDLEA